MKVRSKGTKVQANGTQVMIQLHFCPECSSIRMFVQEIGNELVRSMMVHICNGKAYFPRQNLWKSPKIWYFDLYDKLGQTNTGFQPVPSPHSYRLCPNQMVTANDDHVELEDNIKKGFHRIPPLSWVSIGGYSAFPNYFSQHWNTHTEDIWFIEEESRLQCWYPNCRNTGNARWARVYFGVTGMYDMVFN